MKPTLHFQDIYDMMVEALEAVAETDYPCEFDHHGLCQAHQLRSVVKDGE